MGTFCHIDHFDEWKRRREGYIDNTYLKRNVGFYLLLCLQSKVLSKGEFEAQEESLKILFNGLFCRSESSNCRLVV